MGSIVDKGLLDYTLRAMYRFGTYTNEDRAVPDYRDGFKPVFRRTIWALSQLGGGYHKAAQLVGDVLGKYHPHGDSAAYGAMRTLVHAPTSPVVGLGNWGTIIDPAAAYRYTNIKMAKYGETFVRPDYVAVSDLVPNYDGKREEPVILPALLPNIFFNGADGIGVGLTTTIPSYTPKSVLTMMVRILKGEQLEINDYVEGLEFKFPFGGYTPLTKDNRKALAHFYKTGEGPVLHRCELKLSNDRTLITVDNFCPEIVLEGSEKESKKTGKKRLGAIEKIRLIDGVNRAENATSKSKGERKKSVKFEIEIKKFRNEEDFKKCVGKIQEILSAQRNYRMVLTERKKVNEDVEVRLFTTNVPDLMKMWLKWRVQLEAKMLDYRINREKGDIAYTKLMIFAHDNLEVIFKALKQKNESPDEYLVKHLKITAEQAKQILDRPTRQLSALDKTKLEERLKAQKKTLEELQEMREKPSHKVRADFKTLLEKMDAT